MVVGVTGIEPVTPPVLKGVLRHRSHVGIQWDYVLRCSGDVRRSFSPQPRQKAAFGLEFMETPHIAKVRVGRSIRLARSKFPNKTNVIASSWFVTQLANTAGVTAG